jgi:hypothetical protein
MTSTYITTDMHEALVDFLLTLDPSFGITLFDGGAIVRCDETDERVLVVTTTPEAEAEAFSPLCDADEFALIEQTLADNHSAAMRELAGEWFVADDEPFDLPLGSPLEYFVIEREPSAA